MAPVRESLETSFEVARQNTHDAALDFLQSEIGAGIVFADLALSTQNAETRRRNISNALIAYSAIIRFRERVVFTQAEASRFISGLAQLKDKLAKLGQFVDTKPRTIPTI